MSAYLRAHWARTANVASLAFDSTRIACVVAAIGLLVCGTSGEVAGAVAWAGFGMISAVFASAAWIIVALYRRDGAVG